MTATGHTERAVSENSESTSYGYSQMKEPKRFKECATRRTLSDGVVGLAPGHCRRKAKNVKMKE